MALTPSFVMTLETNMRMISSQHYQALLGNLWWQRVAKTMPTKTKKERVNWFLETAKIQKQDDGEARFEELVMKTYEVEHEFAGSALRVPKTELEDLDGSGVDQASEWSRQVGIQAAYWPQKSVGKAILANPVGYDGKTFFAGDHPVNPFDDAAGTFANHFTGAADAPFPGALPIDDSVTLDAAIANIYKARVYISAIKSPNGEDPRHLQINGIMVPPALERRAIEITNARSVVRAVDANGAGGSENVEEIVRNMNLGQPIVAPELGLAMGGSDTDYYLLVSEIASDDLGAWAYLDRQPFEVGYHGPFDDAQLQRIKQFEWEMSGRNAVAPGHPFLMFKGSKT